MRAKKLLFLATAAAASFSSCSYDEYEISAVEEYTRNFLKEFGLIDPAQDWNLAQGTNVTVKVGATPAHVKAYMKVDDTYYLVADLENVSGTVKVPFDMPEGTSDIMVKINGKRYFTSPGGTVDPSGVGSRALLNKGTTTFAGVQVTVEENTHGRVLTLTPETVDEAIDFLPESDEGAPEFKETNFGKVTQNFFATAQEFYIFPEYWKTDGYSRNIIGVYWYVDADTDGAEEIIRYEAGWGNTHVEGHYWIMRVPFFQNPTDFMTPYDENDNALSFTDNSALVKDAAYYKSKGVHVKFNKTISFGFYLQQDANIMYSESKLNEYCWINGYEGNWYQPSYVATFKNDTDTEGNDKRHLCFEDWYKGNWDLNDMVFRVYGFDNLADGNKTFAPGSILDIDTGKSSNEEGDNDNDNKEDPTIKESEDAYNWLLAVEDLGATDDFDFNDIVMGVSAVTVSVTGGDLPAGTRIVGNPATDDSGAKIYKKVTFKALAAGGTRKAYAFYGDELLYPDGYAGRAEWHAWFGNGSFSSTTMINTGYGTDNKEGATCTIYFGSFTLATLSGSVDAWNNQFKVGIDSQNTSSSEISKDYFEIGDDGYFVKPSGVGAAPQMFLIPDLWDNGNGKWRWPKERSHISSCYPGFTDWVKEGTGAADWYKTPSGDVITRY